LICCGYGNDLIVFSWISRATALSYKSIYCQVLDKVIIVSGLLCVYVPYIVSDIFSPKSLLTSWICHLPCLWLHLFVCKFLLNFACLLACLWMCSSCQGLHPSLSRGWCDSKVIKLEYHSFFTSLFLSYSMTCNTFTLRNCLAFKYDSGL